MRPTVVTVTLREALSEDGLRRLADRFGGETIRIPRAAGRGPMHSTLAELLEQADLDRLTATIGGDTVYVPNGTAQHHKVRREAVRKLADGGMTVAQIARREGLAVRSVQRILKAVRVTRAGDSG